MPAKTRGWLTKSDFQFFVTVNLVDFSPNGQRREGFLNVEIHVAEVVRLRSVRPKAVRILTNPATKPFKALPFRAESRRSLRNKPTFHSAVKFLGRDCSAADRRRHSPGRTTGPWPASRPVRRGRTGSGTVCKTPAAAEPPPSWNNPPRAGVVTRSQDWEWSSLAPTLRSSPAGLLSVGPLPKRPGWIDHVNGIDTEGELQAVRHSIVRGTPFGSESWQQTTAQLLGVESSLRPRGRPTKK